MTRRPTGRGPGRDPWAHDGDREAPPGPRVGGAPRITVHRHRTANGQRVLVGSQPVTVTGCVLDRCYSHGALTATTVRGAGDENSQRVPPAVRRAVEEMPQACQRDGGCGLGAWGVLPSRPAPLARCRDRPGRPHPRPVPEITVPDCRESPMPRIHMPTQAAAGDGYAHLPRRRPTPITPLSKHPARGLCGALLTSTITHHAPPCPSCATRGRVPPSRLLGSAEATPSNTRSRRCTANAEICASGDAAKDCLALVCPACSAVLCDVEVHDELAVLCSVAADHQATCHPTCPQQPPEAATHQDPRARR
jgi:hypothetical protein